MRLLPRPPGFGRESLETSASGDESPPRLWLHIAVTWVMAGLCIGAIVGGTLWFLGFPEIPRPEELSLRAFEAVLVRAFAVMAGLSGIALLVIAYHRQRNNDLENLRAHRAAERDGVKLFNDRFTSAYTELGNEQATARLGAVYALAHLADDAPDPGLRQTCIDVLCTYLRMPHAPRPGDDVEPGSPEYQEYEAFREVRRSIVRAIGDRLRDEDSPWHGHRFDFSDVVFDGGTLRSVHFLRGKFIFNRAVFAEGDLDLRYSRVVDANMNFRNARFTGGTVNLRHVRFEGGFTDFYKAGFEGSEVLLHDVRIAPKTINLTGVRFASGRVEFDSHRGEPALGDPPDGLLDAVAAGEPGVVRLPGSWTSTSAENGAFDDPEETPSQGERAGRKMTGTGQPHLSGTENL
ncbi:hypothetical protein [Nocardiopsis alba]|nr:hypothetical protein [Nocardiopsis alba]